MSVTNLSDLSSILKERLRSELSGTVSSVLNKLLKSEEEFEGKKLGEDELLLQAVAEVSKTERYWKTRNNILLDCRRLHMEPTPVRSSYSYLPNDQIEELGELLYHPDLELRLKSLDYLLRCVSNESLLALPGWKRLENGLRLNVLHEVSVLSEVALQVYTKFLHSPDSRLVKEIYGSLLKTLGVRLGGFDKESPNNPKVRIVKVMVAFLRDLPPRWVRYPEAAIYSIIADTVLCLDSCKWAAIGRNDDDVEDEIGLGYGFGLVDPRADWLKSLLQAAPVRIKFLQRLSSRRTFVGGVIDMVNDWDYDCNVEFDLIESLSILCRLIESTEGSNLIGLDADSFRLWHKIVTIVSRLPNDLEIKAVDFFSIEKILEKNLRHGAEIIKPFLTPFARYSPSDGVVPTTADRLYSLTVLRRALGTSYCRKSLVTAELTELISDYLVKTSTDANEIDVTRRVIEIYSLLISEPSAETVPFLSAVAPRVFHLSDDPLTRDVAFGFMRRITDTCSGLHLVAKIRSVSKEVFVNWVSHVMEGFTRSLPLTPVVGGVNLQYSLSLITDIVNVSNALCYLNDVVPIIVRSLWSKFACICDGYNLNVIEKIYLILVPYYPRILADYQDGDFSILPLLLHFLSDQDEAQCQECIQTLSLKIFRLIFQCVPNILFFQTRYDIRQRIVESLMEYTLQGLESPIVDENSILKNHLLVQTGMLGGPGEKTLPPCYLSTPEYTYPFLNNLNYPLNFVVELSGNDDQVDVQSSDRDSLARDFINYLKRCRVMDNDLDNRRKFWFALLDIEQRNLEAREEPERIENLIAEDKLMVKMYLDYAVSHNWLDTRVNHYENACQMMANREAFVYLACYVIGGGVSDKVGWGYSLADRSYLTHLTRHCRHYDGSDVITTNFSRHFDYIVQKELPTVFNSFRMSSLKPSDALRHWTSQCFCNILTMSDLASLLLFCIVGGPEEILFWGVAVLEHYKEEILSKTNQNNLSIFLVEFADTKNHFNIASYLETVEELRGKYAKIDFIE